MKITNTSDINDQLIKLLAFAEVIGELRRTFPEHARELDRCIYDVGRRNTPRCGDAGCYCHTSFDDFHRDRDRRFKQTRPPRVCE